MPCMCTDLDKLMMENNRCQIERQRFSEIENNIEELTITIIAK